MGITVIQLMKSGKGGNLDLLARCDDGSRKATI